MSFFIRCVTLPGLLHPAFAGSALSSSHRVSLPDPPCRFLLSSGSCRISMSHPDRQNATFHVVCELHYDIVTFVCSKVSFIIKVAMGSGHAEYDRMKRKPYYARLIAVWPEDIMQARSRPEKYGKRLSGGKLCRKMRINTVNNVIYANAWDNLRSSPKCLTNRYYCLTCSKKGVLISLTPLHRQQHRHATNTFSWPQIIAQSG